MKYGMSPMVIFVKRGSTSIMISHLGFSLRAVTMGFKLMLCKESAHNIFRLLMCRDINMHARKVLCLILHVSWTQYMPNREPS